MARTITPLAQRLLADFAVLDAYHPAPNAVDESFTAYEASGVLHARNRCWSASARMERVGTLRSIVSDAAESGVPLCANCFATAVTAKLGPQAEAYLVLASASAEADRFERLDASAVTLDELFAHSISIDITVALLAVDAGVLQTSPAAAAFSVTEERLHRLAAHLRSILTTRRAESIPLLAAWSVTHAPDESAAARWRHRFDDIVSEPEVLIAVDRRSLELDSGGVSVDALALECWTYRQSPCGSLDLLRAPALLAAWLTEFAVSPSSRFGEDPAFAVTVHDPAGFTDAQLETAMVLWDPFDPGAYPDFRSALLAAQRL